jgi:hypothetical protein
MSINHDVQVHPSRLLAYISLPPPPPAAQGPINIRYSCSGDLSLSPYVCCFLFAFSSLALRARYTREQSLRNLALLLRYRSG